MTVRSDAPPVGAPAWAACIAGGLLVGSVGAVDPSGSAPFGPAKWLVVSVIGLTTAGALLSTGRVPLHRGSLLAWCVLLGLLGVAALAGGDVPTALLGQPDRHLGWVTWLICLLMFAAGQQLDRESAQRVAVRAAALAALSLGAWTSWELIVGQPIEIDAVTSRATGPFGSAAYLGAAASLLVPIAIGLAADRTESRPWRSMAAAGAATGTVALIASGARAAWIGVLASLVAVAIAQVRAGRVTPTRRTMWLGVATAAVVATLVGVLVASTPWFGDVLERPAGATSRVDEWAMAGRVIAEHPVIGVGPEGYRIAVSEGIDRHYERTYGRDAVLPDRAHSGPLDVALAGGVPAAIVFVGLVGFVCWRALRLSRWAAAPMVGLATGVIAYAVQQLMLFPLAEIDPVWWLLAGMVVTASGPGAASMRASVWSHRAPALLAFTLGGFALVAGALDVAADRLAKEALDASAAGRPDAAVERAERASTLRPDNVRYRLVAAEVLARRGALADIDRALEQTRRALDWSPRDPLAVDAGASLLLDRAAITGEAADVEASLTAWRQLVERDPLRARWQLQYGRAAALAGDVETARAAWSTAADLSPRDTTAPALLAGLDAGAGG